MNKILVIIPAYNEEKNIAQVIQSLKETVPWAHILVINDGSGDETAQVAHKAGAEVISLPVNLGIGGAVQTGFLYGWNHDYDLALQVDADGQHKAEEIRKLIQPVQEQEVDVAIGSRFLTKTSYRSSWSRRFGIFFLSLAIRTVTKQRFTDPTSGFRAYNRKALKLLSSHYSIDYPEPDAIVTLLRNGLRLRELSVEMEARQFGRSSITPLKSGYYMFKVSLAIVLNSMMTRIWREEV